MDKIGRAIRPRRGNEFPQELQELRMRSQRDESQEHTAFLLMSDTLVQTYLVSGIDARLALNKTSHGVGYRETVLDESVGNKSILICKTKNQHLHTSLFL